LRQNDRVTVPVDPSPDELSPARRRLRRLPSPVVFAAMVVVGAIVVALCVLGATLTGVFSLHSTSDGAAAADTSPSYPAPPFVAPTRALADHFGDGQWIVNDDVRPGTYVTTVPATSPGCSWEREGAGNVNGVPFPESGSGHANEQITIFLSEKDTVVSSEGCGTWHRVV
jgi:hypothetical protein